MMPEPSQEHAVRLYLFQIAIFGKVPTPVPAYLIQTDDGTNVVVDTGFPPEITTAPPPDRPNMGIHDVIPIRTHLAGLGIIPDDVQYLIVTHLDPDHGGETDAFPNAEIVIQRAHYEAALHATDYRYAMNRPHWDAPGLRYRFVDGDTEFLPGIELIETSGHVPGHQSVLVRLANTGPVLLAIDAMNHAGQSDPETRPVSDFDWSEEATRASTRKLQDLIAREHVQLVIYGHDRNQWPTLKKASDYYD
jgi:N-acyl homoserine lactone hydrolase